MRAIHLLLIEDNTTDALILQEALREKAALNAFKVTVADRLSSGMDRLAEGSFDLILLDLGLPDSSGLDTLKVISNGHPGVPVVVITGHSDEEMAVSAVGNGAQDYLVKGEAGARVLERVIRYSIERQHLFQELQKSNLEIRRAYDATIEGWARALDLRDHDTEGHARRVTDGTVRLARLLGITDEVEVENIRRGALLHDIGKMAIPDDILLKPGPLNDEEWEKMKQHPVYAYRLLEPIEYLKPALEIPYCHHEKWDGSGYPRGLDHDQIPFSARAFAVVDVWDALTSDRPYRKAWTKREAYEHILSQSGKQFEPRIVDVFLSEIVGKE
jgi:response regulator RpfG family c-di-GMP phosphodiesterase